jgi:large subunit ribosomal protein L18
MSIKVNQKLHGRLRRKMRVRKKIFGTAARPRLSVFRSAKHIYAQVIDDVTGQTLAAAGTASKAAQAQVGKKTEQAGHIGQLIAEACKKKNIEAVVFDRNGFRYHPGGRVQALADAARAGGLKF